MLLPRKRPWRYGRVEGHTGDAGSVALGYQVSLPHYRCHSITMAAMSRQTPRKAAKLLCPGVSKCIDDEKAAPVESQASGVMRSIIAPANEVWRRTVAQ